MIAGMLTSLPTPTRDGYIFTGWYDDPQSDKPESNKNEASPYNVYSSATEIHAHWCKKWADGSKDWVRATTIKELESAELPFLPCKRQKNLRTNILCDIRILRIHMRLL